MRFSVWAWPLLLASVADAALAPCAAKCLKDAIAHSGCPEKDVYCICNSPNLESDIDKCNCPGEVLIQKGVDLLCKYVDRHHKTTTTTVASTSSTKTGSSLSASTPVSSPTTLTTTTSSGTSKVSSTGTTKVSSTDTSKVSSTGTSKVSSTGTSKVSSTGTSKVSSTGTSKISSTTTKITTTKKTTTTTTTTKKSTTTTKKPTTTSKPPVTCSLVPVKPKPKFMVCGSEGFVAKPALLKKLTAKNLDTCTTLCQADRKCVSYSFKKSTTSCRLYKNTVIGQGFVKFKSGRVFYNRFCFSKKCSQQTTTATTSWHPTFTRASDSPISTPTDSPTQTVI